MEQNREGERQDDNEDDDAGDADDALTKCQKRASVSRSRLYLTASSSKLMKYASCRPSSPSEEHKSAAIKTTPGREAGEEEESRGRCEDDARTEQNIDAYRHDRSVCRIQTGGNRVSRNEVLHSESGNRELQFPNFNPM